MNISFYEINISINRVPNCEEQKIENLEITEYKAWILGSEDSRIYINPKWREYLRVSTIYTSKDIRVRRSKNSQTL